jgi:hypothetical protein
MKISRITDSSDEVAVSGQPSETAPPTHIRGGYLKFK